MSSGGIGPRSGLMLVQLWKQKLEFSLRKAVA